MTALRKSDGSEYHCTAWKNQRCAAGRSAWAQHVWFWKEQAASGSLVTGAVFVPAGVFAKAPEENREGTGHEWRYAPGRGYVEAEKCRYKTGIALCRGRRLSVGRVNMGKEKGDIWR